MEHAQAQDVLASKFARGLVRYKARQLSRTACFNISDVEDLQQELWLSLLQQLKRFDPAKATLDTFMNCVVQTTAAMILRTRARTFDMRVGQISLSKEVRTQHEQGTCLFHTICEADLARRLGLPLKTSVQELDDAEAFDVAWSRLTPACREMCDRLVQSTESAVAATLNMSRRQFRKVLAWLSEHFLQYLQLF